MSALRSELAVIEALASGGAITLEEIYAACEAAGVTARDDGEAVVRAVREVR